MFKKESFENIERLEIMEDRYGITFEGLNIEIEADDTYGCTDLFRACIYAEIHSVNGTNINDDLQIVATAFNKEGKVIGATSASIYKVNFFAVEELGIRIGKMIEKPAKIRVYPRK
jgi:hypothetical protein